MMVLMASFTQFLSSIVVQKTFISTLLDSISIRVTSKALNYSGKETNPTQSSRADIKLIHGLTSQTHILPFSFDKFFFSPAVSIFSVWQIESLSICEPFTMARSLWLVHHAWWVCEVDSFVFDFKSTALFLNHRRPVWNVKECKAGSTRVAHGLLSYLRYSWPKMPLST